jgi:hypothetical protein
MAPAIKGHSSSRQNQASPSSFFSSHNQTNSTLEKTTKKVVLVGCALLATAGVLYFCACNRNEESWCELKSNAQILSNMGLVADVFRS